MCILTPSLPCLPFWQPAEGCCVALVLYVSATQLTQPRQSVFAREGTVRPWWRLFVARIHPRTPMNVSWRKPSAKHSDASRFSARDPAVSTTCLLTDTLEEKVLFQQIIQSHFEPKIVLFKQTMDGLRYVCVLLLQSSSFLEIPWHFWNDVPFCVSPCFKTLSMLKLLGGMAIKESQFEVWHLNTCYSHAVVKKNTLWISHLKAIEV